METRPNLLPDNQGVDGAKTTSNKGGISIATIIGLALVIIGLWNGFGPGSRASESDARESAEKRVQSTVFSSTGVTPKTESAIVYKNKDYYVVGVNYTLGDSFKEGLHHSRIILCSRSSGTVFKSSDDVGGWNIHKLTNDQLNQIKVLWELD